MENCRLLMRICPNAFVACDVPMMQMRLLKFHLYIYGGEPSKSMKFPMDSSFVTQSFFPLLLFPPSPTSIGQRRWRSYEGRLLEEDCVFKHDICVDLPDVLDGKLDYANSPFLEFFARARCPPVLAPSGAVTVKVYG